jgi:hypothetical protein
VSHQRLGALGDGGEGIDGNIHRALEILARGLDVAARQLVLVGKGDRVDEEVEPAPARLDLGEDGVDAGEIGHVAMAGDDRAEFGRKRLDALLESVALVGQRKLGALRGAGLRDAPGNGAVVCHAQDEPALAGQKAVATRHCISLRFNRPEGSHIAQGIRRFKLRLHTRYGQPLRKSDSSSDRRSSGSIRRTWT